MLRFGARVVLLPSHHGKVTRDPSAGWEEGASQGEDEQEREHGVGPRHGWGGEV